MVVETAGDFDGRWYVRDLLPLVDLTYFDVKVADADGHLRHCGRDNQRILANLTQLLAAAPARVEVRIPLVPGITATPENLRAVARRLRNLGAGRAMLLPYNPLGRDMSVRLGRERSAMPSHFMTDAEVREAITTFVAAASP